MDKLIDLGSSEFMNFDKFYAERINSYAWSLAASYKMMMLLATENEFVMSDPDNLAQKLECALWSKEKCNHYCNELLLIKQ